MAVPAMDRPSGPSRTASLQRMLDLEQRYKLARINSDRNPPLSSPISETFLALEPQSKQPLQARRRNPKEQLAQMTGDLTLQSSRRNHHGPPLSITIPAPTSPDSDRPVETEMITPKVEKYEAATRGREKTVTFFEAGEDDDQDLDKDEDEDEDSDGESVQSSICHSPSWEVYGRKKKDKKAKAEKKRQEKAKADQELKSAKKRLANRLAKMPPASASATTSSTSVTTALTPAVAPGKLSRGLSAPLIRFGSQTTSSSSQDNKLEKPAAHKSWGLASFASNLVASAANPYPSHGTKSIAAAKEKGRASAQVHVSQDTQQQQHGNSSSRKASRPDNQVDTRPSTGHGTTPKPLLQKAHTIATSEQELREMAPVSKNARVMTMPEAISNGISYPPPASRTHVLRQAPGTSHARVNSTPTVASTKTDEATKFSKAQNMRSTQTSKVYGAGNAPEESLPANATANDRGRQRSSSSNGYVRRSRDQSTERSLAGLNDEIAVSEACALQQPSKRANPRRLTAFLKHEAGGEGKAVLSATESHPSRSADADAAEKPEDHTDYLNFVNGTYNPPSLELTSPAPGLLSSLRFMMSRRSSASSAQGMQLPASAHNSSHVLARPHPEHGGPRSGPPSRLPLSAASVNDIPEAVVLPPKAARVLGEYHPTAIGSQAPLPGSRPSEGSSMSSYHDDSSVPPSPASTPDTSRPQSTKGADSSVDDNQIGPLDISLPRDDTVRLATARYHAVSRDSATINETLSSTKTGRDPHSQQRLERPLSRGRALDDLERPPSRGRLLELGRRPLSKSRAYEDLRPMANSEDPILLVDDDRWSRTAMPIDTDAQSFVTTLTSLDDIDDTLPHADDEMTTRWDFLGVDSRPGSNHSQMDGGIIGFNGKDRERARSSDSRREIFAVHTNDLPFEHEDMRPVSQHANVARMNGEYRGHLIANSTNDEASFLPPVTQQIVIPPKSKARMSAPLSAPLPVQATIEPRLSTARSQTSSSSSSSGTPSAAYLHEARRSAPLVPSLLSNTTRPKATNPPAPAAVAVTGPRPALKPTSTTPASVPRQQSILKAATTATPLASTTPFHASAPDLSIGQTSSHNHMVSTNNGQPSKPVAKMLVECCSCKFFLDMPSRVYECMAQPDAVVTDRALGVSGAITTMVKCPWCAHNMSTKCCAGYAAVVYLKERMH